jgi:hypothetical protein
MHRIAIATLSLLSLFAPHTASAQTLWLCGLSQDALRLVCVAEADPTLAAGASAPEVSAVVNGTAFPLNPNRLYTVDLLSPATDMPFVEQLAKATICYRSAECRVLMTNQATQPASAQRPQGTTSTTSTARPGGPV